MKNLNKHISTIALIMTASVLAAPVFAQSSGTATEATTEMPMAEGQAAADMEMMKNKGENHMMGDGEGGMPMMKMMKERQEKMDAHMGKMESSMSNIEALLKELVDLQKNGS